MKRGPVSPFGAGWSYVSCHMRSQDGVCVDSQLWKNKKTGELRWHIL